MTLDNTEAFITVGQSVPFKTGGSGGTDNPFTIDRKDVGTTLKVTPHIQQNGTIRLEVDQVVESLLEKVVAGASDLVTSKRQVKTEILVDDKSTIVLGGLISDRVSEVESGIPILKNIPILGVLFRSKGEKQEKTNLMIILRPTIVTDNLDHIRDRRLDGIWELRIDAFGGSRQLIQPSIDDVFDGNYMKGAPE